MAKAPPCSERPQPWWLALTIEDRVAAHRTVEIATAATLGMTQEAKAEAIAHLIAAFVCEVGSSFTRVDYTARDVAMSRLERSLGERARILLAEIFIR